MQTQHTPRTKWFVAQYVAGFEQCNPSNDAADEILQAPDTHLLSQQELFKAEGGWSNFALSVGLSGAFLLALFGAQPRVFSHFKNGNMNFREWALFGGAAWAGLQTGHHVGLLAFGDYQRYQNHWIAYTYVKSLNRFEGRTILTNKPSY